MCLVTFMKLIVMRYAVRIVLYAADRRPKVHTVHYE